MRPILYFGFALALLAGDGRTPRSSSSDYPVHQDTTTATIAAVRVPAEQLNKTFPSDFAKKYVVVEVAIYPKDGSTVDVVSPDFVLRLADTERHPDTAEEVAGMWRPRSSPSPELTRNTHVTADTGVIVQNGTDPNTGRRVNGVGTYESVGVNNYPSQTQPPPSTAPHVDVDRMEAQLAKWALPEGKITAPVAGYLYFPVPAKKNKGATELQYEHQDSSAKLTLAAPTK